MRKNLTGGMMNTESQARKERIVSRPKQRWRKSSDRGLGTKAMNPDKRTRLLKQQF
jgi:hypothetical protein